MRSQHEAYVARRLILAAVVALILVGLGIYRTWLSAKDVGGGSTQLDVFVWVWAVGVGLLLVLWAGWGFALNVAMRRVSKGDSVVFVYRRTRALEAAFSKLGIPIPFPFFSIAVADRAGIRFFGWAAELQRLQWHDGVDVSANLAEYQGYQMPCVRLELSSGPLPSIELLPSRSGWGIIYPMGDRKVSELCRQLNTLK